MIQFTADHKSMRGFKIGRHSYGVPLVLGKHPDATLEIGSFCSIAAGVTILLAVEHRPDWITTYPFPATWNKSLKGHPATKGDVVIGHDVWIGQNVTILSGVRIGSGACIGAGSVVTKHVPPYAIVCGNPAREIRRRFSEADIAFLLTLQWWNKSDEEVERLIPVLCSGDIKALRRLAK